MFKIKLLCILTLFSLTTQHSVSQVASVWSGYIEQSSYTLADIASSPDGQSLYVLYNHSSLSSSILIRLNATSRTLVWRKTLPGSYAPIYSALTVDTDGYIYLTSRDYYSPKPLEGGRGSIKVQDGTQTDAVLLKLDTNGNTVWTKHVGGEGTENIVDMVVEADGSLFLVGQTSSSVMLDSMPNGNSRFQGIQDIFVQKRDKQSGALIWSRYLGGNSTDSPVGLAKTNQGLYIVGKTVSTDISVSATLGNSTLLGVDGGLLAKLDAADGRLLWQRYVGSTGLNDFSAITAQDDQIYIAGRRDEYGNMAVPMYQSTLQAYKENGELAWERTLGSGYGQNHISSIGVDSEGQIVVSGMLEEEVEPVNGGLWIDHALDGTQFLGCYSTSGTLKYLSYLPSNLPSPILTTNPNGMVTIAGKTSNNTAFGAKLYSFSGSSSHYVLQLSAKRTITLQNLPDQVCSEENLNINFSTTITPTTGNKYYLMAARTSGANGYDTLATLASVATSGILNAPIPAYTSGDSLVVFVVGTSPWQTSGIAATAITKLNPALVEPQATAYSFYYANFHILYWPEVAGTDRYRVDISTKADFSTKLPGYDNLKVTGTKLLVPYTSSQSVIYYRVCPEGACATLGGCKTISSYWDYFSTKAQPNAATGVTCNEFRVTAQTDSDEAYLQVSTNTAFTQIVPGYDRIRIGTKGIRVTGLDPSKTYYYRVQFVAMGLATSWGPYRSVTTLAAYSSLTKPSLFANVSCPNISLNWSNIAGATKYELEIATDAAFTQMVPNYNPYWVNSSSITLYDLLQSKTYYIRVRAYSECSGAYSAYSSVREVVASQVPPYPTLSFSNVSSTGFTVNYPTLTKTQLLYYSNSRVWDPNNMSTVSVFLGSSSYTFSNLGADQVYYVALGNCEGPQTKYSAIRTNPSNPSVTTASITAVSINERKQCFPYDLNVKVEVDGNFASGNQFIVEVSTSNTFSNAITKIGSLSATTASTIPCSDVAQLSQGTYYLRVRSSLNACTLYYHASIVIETQPNMPYAYTPTISQACENRISVTLPSSKNYRVYIARDANFSQLESGYAPLSLNSIGSNQIGWLPDGQYYLRVTVQNACGQWSGYSNTTSFLVQSTPQTPVLVSTAMTESGTKLTWSKASNDVTRYKIDLATDSQFTNLLVDGKVQSDTTYSYSLQDGDTMHYRITPINSCGKEGTPLIVKTKSPQKASKDFRIVSHSCGRLELSWTKPDINFTNYALQVSRRSNFFSPIFNISVATTSTSYALTDTSLQLTDLFIRLGTRTGQDIYWSDTLLVQGQSPALPAPSNVSLSGDPCGLLSLSWNAVSGAQKYQIYESASSGFLHRVTVSGSSVSLSSINDGKFMVVAVSPAGCTSLPSAIANIDSLQIPVTHSSVVDLGYTFLDCRTAILKWAEVPNATAYYIKTYLKRSDLGIVTQLDIIPEEVIWGYDAVPNISCKDGLCSLTVFLPISTTGSDHFLYEIRARGRCRYTSSSGSPSSSSIEAEWVRLVSPNLQSPNPSPVQLTEAVINGCTSFTATWEPDPTSTNYYIDVATSSDFAAENILADYNNKIIPASNQNKQIDIENLDPGRTYYYRLRKKQCDIISANSDTGIVTTHTPAEQPSTSTLPATAINCTSFEASWIDASGSKHYLLDVSASPSFSSFLPGYEQLNIGDTSKWLVANLEPDATYYYRVKYVRNECQVSSWSDTGMVHMATESTYPGLILELDSISARCGQLGVRNHDNAAQLNIGVEERLLRVATDPLFQNMVPGWEMSSINGNDIVTYIDVEGVASYNTQVFYLQYGIRSMCGIAWQNSSTSMRFNLVPHTFMPIEIVPGYCGTLAIKTENWSTNGMLIHLSTDLAGNNVVAGAYFAQQDSIYTISDVDWGGYQQLYLQTSLFESCDTLSLNPMLVDQSSLQIKPLPKPDNVRLDIISDCSVFDLNVTSASGSHVTYLELSDKPDFSTKILETSNNDGHFILTGLPNGNYYARIHDQDKCGIDGDTLLYEFELLEKPQLHITVWNGNNEKLENSDVIILDGLTGDTLTVLKTNNQGQTIYNLADDQKLYIRAEHEGYLAMYPSEAYLLETSATSNLFGCARIYVDIYMRPNSQASGDGAISGTAVYEGGKRSGLAVSKLPLLLVSNDEQYIYRQITPEDGSFNFGSLPLGTYRLMADKWGIRNMETAPSITITQSKPVIENLIVIVHDDHLELVYPQSVDRESRNSTSLTMGPIPTGNQLYVQASNPIIYLEIRDNQGKVVLKQYPNSRSCQIYMGHLSSGIYGSTIQTNYGTFYRKILHD